MASTPLGRRLTERHRLAQQQVRAAFLAEFLVLWALLDSRRLDETSPAWVRAVLALIRDHRLRSMQVATSYYLDFRTAESPARPTGPRVLELPAQPADERRAQPGRRPSQAPSRATPGRRVDSRTNVVPEPRRDRRSNALDILDEIDRQQRDRQGRRGRVDVPDISWGRADRVAKVSVTVAGVSSQKSKAKRGRPLEQARDEAFTQAAGVAARHVLTGGRQSLLTLLDEDPRAVGWARVTDGDPCAFCAMLSSRGIVYKTEASASFQAHDNCACTAEPAYSRSAPLPGRGQEFQDLWNAEIRGRYSGKDALNAWRRLLERQQREARRGEVA